MSITYVTRTQTLLIVKRNHPLFKTIDDLSFKAKNVYNSSLYLCRQEYFKTKRIISYSNLHTIHKFTYQEDYKSLPIQTTQQILRVVQKTMESFKASSKDYINHPEKYKSRPKLPKYKDSQHGRFSLYFTNQQVKYKDHHIYFPKSTGIPPLKTHLTLDTPDADEFALSKSIESPIRQVRIIPLLNQYKIELIYTKELQTPETNSTYQEGNVASIDLGIDNFASIVTYGLQTCKPYRPLILNGKGLKSYNKQFNKKLSSLKSAAKLSNNKHTTQAIQNLINKRNRVYLDFYHKASKATIEYLLKNQVSVLVIGYNKDWKQQCPLSKVVNQTFIQLGYQTYINQLIYKCQEHQIRVLKVNESYTSGTSFLDSEDPTQENYNKTRRIHRGTFKHSNPAFKYPTINADINASYQILSKASHSKLKYNPELITKASITPIVQNLDTFRRSK